MKNPPTLGAATSAMLLLSVALIPGCTEASFDSPIPAYNISYSVNINTVGGVDEGTTDLRSGGSWVAKYNWSTASSIIGVGGLFICHDHFEQGQYHAYDMACPYCYRSQAGSKLNRLQFTTALKVMTTDGYGLRCPDCESEFGYTFQGLPVASSGPANVENIILRKYTARLNGDIVYVSK